MSLSSRENFQFYSVQEKSGTKDVFYLGRCLDKFSKTARNEAFSVMRKIISKRTFSILENGRSILMFSLKGSSVFFNLRRQWFAFSHLVSCFSSFRMIYLISFYFVSASFTIKNEFICSIVMYNVAKKEIKVRKSFFHA